MTPQVVVGAALVDDLTAPTRLLAARRTAPPELAGLWEFPGGKVEPGESLEAALHRELAEELAVLIELGGQVTGPVELGDGATAWPLRGGWVMHVRLARVLVGHPTATEHDDLRWLTPEELGDVPWIPADGPIVAAVAELLAGQARR